MSDESAEGPVEIIQCPVELDYTYTAGQATTRFLRGVGEGKLLGQRCIVCGKIYVASRGACPIHGVPTGPETVEVSDKGTLVSFSIVRIPSENLSVDPPFAAISVLLDGSDSTFMHVLSDCPLEEVRMGMRVEAVWIPKEEWTTSLKNITHFRPLDEPDAPYDSYKEHL
ncbi:MAG: Zn-ribbon domain-containing OB-fold protein [Myxococcota bacterium]|nr:Zn-ribbon domain-containing OB-fold protein [Myxococcota bacterium]